MDQSRSFDFVNIGRNKISKRVKVSGPQWQDQLYNKVLKCLGSRDVELIPNEKDTGWDVFAGFRKVGEVLDVKNT